VSAPSNLPPASDGDFISVKSSTRKISFENQENRNGHWEEAETKDEDDGDGDSAYGDDMDEAAEPQTNDDQGDNVSFEDFDSNQSMRNVQIEVSEELVERCATQLSVNEIIIKRENSNLAEDKARKLAIQINV
jgi:hypothetical protein